MSSTNHHRFVAFVLAVDHLVSHATSEQSILAEGRSRLGELVSIDDWLPETYAAADPGRYQQYLLYRDPKDRFSVVSFVWGPGQATPVHNHTVWGLVGVMRGAELSQTYEVDDRRLRPAGPLRRLRPGDVETVSPALGDIHRVANAYIDKVSVSIHVYGADIGRVKRSTFAEDGQARPFISGYAALGPLLPDLEAAR